MNLANKLTILRIVMIPIMVVVFYLNFPFSDVIAAGVFLLAAFTDFLDGYIARSRNMVTNLGKFLDPIADKVLVMAAFLMIVDAQIVAKSFEALAWVPSVCVIIILARELIVSGFRLVAATTGLVIAADKLGKIKTVSQDIAIPLLLVCHMTFVENNILLIAGLIVLIFATVMTIWSGISYIVKNRAVFTESEA